jgi:hypothetical protein
MVTSTLAGGEKFLRKLFYQLVGVSVADPDPGSWIRDPVLFCPPDPGSGMEQWSDPDPGSGISKQNL